MSGPAGYLSSLPRGQDRSKCSHRRGPARPCRRAAWRKQGVVVLRPEDVRAMTGSAKRWSTRQPGSTGRDGRPGDEPQAQKDQRGPLVLEEVRERPRGRIVVHHRWSTRWGGCSSPAPSTADGRCRSRVPARLHPGPARSVAGRGPVAGAGQRPRARARHRAAGGAETRAPGAAGLGGHDSPAGSCAWHVLGCGRSVRDGRCARVGVGGRCGRSRRRGCWWPRSDCLRRTMGLRADRRHDRTSRLHSTTFTVLERCRRTHTDE